MEPLTNHSDDLTNVTLVERYHIKAKLGQGGMGSIYTAHDDVLMRDVAIKTVPRNNLNDAEMVRFHREGKAASLVRHPNVIQMLDFGVLDSGQPFIVMEWIKGISIADLLAERGPQSPLFTLKIIEQIANGMTAVHKAGIIHRDLKTSNIMVVDLDTNPLIRILDFGIAKSLAADSQSLTQAGQIFGSTHYMSPEQIRGEAVDQRSDIYSLGCIAFEMITGHTLFEGETAMEIATQHLNEDVPRLWEVTDVTYPLQLERLVAHMVAKDPAERFQSMEEVIRYGHEVQTVLEEALEQERAAAAAAKSAKPLSETQIIRKRKLDTRILVSLIVAASGILIGSLAIVVSPILKKRAEIAPDKLEQGSRRRSLERSQLSLELIDTVDKTVDLEGFAIDHSGNATKRLKQMVNSGKEIHNIVFVESKLVPDDFRLIAKLNPRRVRLQGCTGITDSTVKMLSQIPSIRALNINGCKGITPKGISQLKTLPGLVELWVEDCDFTDEHLKEMKKIQTLTSVFICHNKSITIKGVKYLGDKVLPVEINVDQPPIYLLSKEKQIQLRKEHNIVLLRPQTPGDEFPAKASKYGLEEFVNISKESDTDSPVNPREQKLEKLLMRNFE